MQRTFFAMVLIGILTSPAFDIAQSGTAQGQNGKIEFATSFNGVDESPSSRNLLTGTGIPHQPSEAITSESLNTSPAVFTKYAPSYEIEGFEFLDDFNRATLGPDWTTDPGFEIVNDELSNTSTVAVWDHIAVYTGKTNPLEVAFTYGTGATPVPDIENTAMALMMDAPDPNANGYMIWYRPSIQSLYFYTIENGAPAVKLEHVVSPLPPAESGDEFRVVISSDLDGHYFDCYINGTFYGQLVDPDKLQGNAADLYAGVMLHGARSNDIDDFKTVHLAGPPANLILAAGDEQTGPVNTTLANPLSVQATDVDNNPVVDVPVDFTIIGGSADLDKSPGDGNIRIEAETGLIEPPISRTTDPDASSGEYVETSQSKKGSVTFDFNAALESTYYVWGRVYAEDAEKNSFFALMNSEEDTIIWDIAEQSFGTWNWEKLSDRQAGPLSFNLDAGANQLKIVGREVSARLDRILITDDPDYVPSGLEPAQTYLTASDGTADALLTLGTQAGEIEVRATSPLLPGQFIDFTAFATAGAPANLILVSGDDQIGNAGFPLVNPFVVRVTDEFGNPLENAPVTFAVTEGGGQLSNTQPVETDSAGLAATILTLGEQSPSNTVNATTPGVQEEVVFSASASVGIPSGLISVSGNLQSGPAGEVLPNPFVVKVIDDFNNGVPDQSVSWTVIEGNGTLQDSAITITDSTGSASMSFALGTVSEANGVSAVVGPDTVVFTATANSGIATTIVMQSGNNQTAVVGNQLGSPLMVKVVDAQNSGIAGVSVTFSILQEGDSINEVQPVETDSNGIAQSTWTLGHVSGTRHAQASAPGLSGSPVGFTATAVADVPATMVKVSGDSAMGEANQTLPEQFAVKILDQFSNPVASSPVTFTVIEGGGHFLNDEITINVNTDSAGLAQTFLVLGPSAGSHNNKVFVTKSGVSGSPITFVASANAGGAAKIVMMSGDQQTGLVRQPLTQFLSVKITDSNDNVVEGHEVVFKVESGGGTLNGSVDTVATAQSNADGIASSQFWPGPVAGNLNHTVSVSATNSSGVPLTNSPITFQESAKYPSGRIELVSGNNQTGVVTSVLADSLKIMVLDSSDQPVEDQPVTFRVISGDGSFDNTEETETVKMTNSHGTAAVQFHMGPGVGQNNNRVHAIADDGFDPLQGSPVEFVASATTTAATSMQIVGGNNQTAVVGNSLSEMLRVKVTDVSGTAVPNHPVTFYVKAGGGYFAGGVNDTSKTINSDSSGIARVSLTLGTKSGQSNNRVEAVSTDGFSPLQGSPILFTASANPDLSDENTSEMTATGPVIADGQAVSNITITLRDRYNNPISGKMVVLSVSGSQNFVTQPQTLTNADGRVTGSVSSIVAETKTVTAMNTTDNIQLNSSVVVSFIPGPAARLIRLSGNEQTGNVGTLLKQPLVVMVTDNLDNPVSNVPVVFEVKGGGGYLVENLMPVRTDSSGKTQVHYVLGDQVGFNVIEVWSGSLQGSPDLFSAHGVTGNASKLVYVSGNDQIGTAGNPLQDSLVVKVLDDNDNPVKNVSVNFSVVFGGGSIEQAQPVLTNAFGFARAVFTLGSSIGQHFAKAESPGLSGSPITFFASAGSAGADSLVMLAGDGQSGKVATPGSPVSVQVLDSFDNPVVGYPVWFEALQSDLSFTTPQSDSTDADGIARVSFNYGTSSGLSEILAIANGLRGSPMKFQVTAIPSDAAAVELFGGNNQVAYTGQSLANPIQVKITDQYGNPVPGFAVTYVITQGDASIKGNPSVPSDEEGIASANIRLGSQPGDITVLAVASGLSGSPLQLNVRSLLNNVPWISGSDGSGLPDTTVYENSLLQFMVLGGDPDGDALSFQVKEKPEGVTLDSLDAATWRFSWLPDFDQSGLHPVILEIEDSKGATALDTVNIMVFNVNRSPVITGFLPDTSPTQGELDTTIFRIEAEDPDDDQLAYYWTLDGEVVDDDEEFLFTAPAEASVEIVGYVTDGVDTVSHQWLAVVTGVELEMFAAEAEQAAIRLAWSTKSEANNLGFNVFRSRREDGGYAKVNEALIRSESSGQYAVTDSDVEAGVRYYYQLEDVSAGGIRTLHGPVVATIKLPTEFRVAQNYPNPFNPETTIRFQLPGSGDVRLTIFNILGQKVRALIKRRMEPGYHAVVWDGRDDSGSRVTSGIYYYRIQTEGFSDFRKMLMMK